MKNTKPIIWGIVIIILGIIIAGKAFGWFEFDILFKGWWTLFIIIPAAVSIFTENDKITSFGFLAAGIILMLAAQEVISYDLAWKIILPVVVILIGVSVIIKGVNGEYDDRRARRHERRIERHKAREN